MVFSRHLSNSFTAKRGDHLKKMLYFPAALLCCALVGCAERTVSYEAATAVPQAGIAGMTRAELGAELGDNFYAYVNFERFISDDIPYGKSYTSFGEDWTKKALEKELETILNQKDTFPDGSNEQKIADAYSQYTDEDARNAAGIAALKPFLDKIAAADTIEKLVDISAEIQWETGCGTIFGLSVSADYYDSDTLGAVLTQMALPVDAESLLTSYGAAEDMQTAAESVLKKLGEENAEQRALELTDMLLKIAERTASRDDLFYKTENYIRMSLSEVNALFPNADISGFTDRLKNAGAERLTVMDPEHIKAVGEYLSAENLTAWKDYLTLRLMCYCGEFLPEEYVKPLAALGFGYSEPNDKNAREGILYEFRREMAYIFAYEYADESVIQAARDFAGDIIAAYRDMISDSQKVDDETKRKFLKKFENMQINIDVPHAPYDGGYDWKSGGGFLENMLAKRGGEFRSELSGVGGAFDKTAFDWSGMMPQTYGNAQYVPANYVIIPYATLSEPYFDPNGDYYRNLGMLGMIIGHEISHGFDSMGMRFDENGNLSDWLSDEYGAYLEDKKSRITELYNGYKLFGVYPLDGEKTLGENMADIASMQCMLSITDTPGQKRAVFEAYAESWYMMIYDDTAYEQIFEDEHSLNEFRTNVVVSQLDEFYEAYDIKEGDAMYTAPENRERVWE